MLRFSFVSLVLNAIAAIRFYCTATSGYAGPQRNQGIVCCDSAWSTKLPTVSIFIKSALNIKIAHKHAIKTFSVGQAYLLTNIDKEIGNVMVRVGTLQCLALIKTVVGVSNWCLNKSRLLTYRALGMPSAHFFKLPSSQQNVIDTNIYSQ